MAFRLSQISIYLFSIFKKKVFPVEMGHYKTPQQLYKSLSTFQSELSDLQLKKMPKTLQNFSKKMRRLLKITQKRVINVEMELSHTYESYTRNVDELIFGSEDFQLETNLQQILDLTTQMVLYDLNNYIKCLIPRAETHLTLHQRLMERFINLQERIAREMYKGYFLFSKNVSKVSFLEQRQYKGDFKFQLTSDIAKIEKGIECLYHCALFNRLRDKLALASQLAMSIRLRELSSLSLSKLLFCLASAGRSLKFIENNWMEIKQKVENYPLQLLYYMIMSGVEDSIWFQNISNKITLQPRNVHEQFVAKMVQIILRERFNCFIDIKQKEEFNLINEKHQGEIALQQFLTRLGYTFITHKHHLFHYTIYEIQGKKFICYDHWAIKEESFKLNGIGLIIQQYFHGKQEGIKHINWPRMMGMDKRGPRDEYILSKFKGIDRPKKEKLRYYE